MDGKSRLRVVTYNIYKGIGGVDRLYRPTRIIDVIAPLRPDCVFIQEVDEGAERSMRHCQVDLLGDLLRLPHRVYFPNVKVRWGGHYGAAILSRFPIRCARNIDVTVLGTKRRSVLHGEIRVRRTDGARRFRTIHLYTLHLGLSQALRERQLARFPSSHPFVSSHPRTPFFLVRAPESRVSVRMGPLPIGAAHERAFLDFPTPVGLESMLRLNQDGPIQLKLQDSGFWETSLRFAAAARCRPKRNRYEDHRLREHRPPLPPRRAPPAGRRLEESRID